MKICERDLARIWQEGRFRRLRDEHGNEVEIVYGGRPVVGPGCDFRDAVLKIKGIKICGDVEIHVGTDLWRRHGHERNPQYINVILHVAMWDRGGLPALLPGGRNVPTVILSNAPAQFSVPPNGCPQAGRIDSGELEKTIQMCGLERLAIKAQEFAGLIESMGRQQAFYLGVCRALGYSRNKIPMVRLAELLSFSWWVGMQKRGPEFKLMIALGIAGLLPSSSALRTRPDALATIMQHKWELYGYRGEIMQRSEWCFSAIRPAGSPLRRVAALCYLMGKKDFLDLQRMRDLIINTEHSRLCSRLEIELMVGEQGYWAGHYDFGRPLRRPMALIGRGRAREIVVNCISPFFLALAHEEGDRLLAQRIYELYQHAPALPQNEVTRFMQQLLMPGGVERSSALRQQGLLHIFHEYCRTRDCGRCQLAKRRRKGWEPHRGVHYRYGLT